MSVPFTVTIDISSIADKLISILNELKSEKLVVKVEINAVSDAINSANAAVVAASVAASTAIELANTAATIAANIPANITSINNANVAAINNAIKPANIPANVAAINNATIPANVAAINNATIAATIPANITSINNANVAAIKPANVAAINNATIAATIPANVAAINNATIAANIPANDVESKLRELWSKFLGKNNTKAYKVGNGRLFVGRKEEMKHVSNLWYNGYYDVKTFTYMKKDSLYDEYRKITNDLSSNPSMDRDIYEGVSKYHYSLGHGYIFKEKIKEAFKFLEVEEVESTHNIDELKSYWKSLFGENMKLTKVGQAVFIKSNVDYGKYLTKLHDKINENRLNESVPYTSVEEYGGWWRTVGTETGYQLKREIIDVLKFLEVE